jgi:hypothetical protein
VPVTTSRKLFFDAVAAVPEEIVAALEEIMAEPEEIVAAPEEIVAAPEEIVAAPEEFNAMAVAAPVEIVAVVAVSRASIADVVYGDDGVFMFKNVDAINDSKYLSAADLQKLECEAVKTATKTSKKRKKTTEIDMESSGILGVQMKNKKRCFLVHWTSGWQTWEPTENVSNLIGVMNYMSSVHNEVIHVE